MTAHPAIDRASEETRLSNLIRYTRTCIRFADDEVEIRTLQDELAHWEAELALVTESL